MNDFKTVQIPTGSITVSKLNPRKHFDPDKLLELAGSIKDKGILQPILVRSQGKKYEIICGERRYRAAVHAGLKEIPSIVRDLDDKQVLEIQVIENLQREDVHPLEEAEGYEALMKKHGYKDVKDIAVKVGKSTAYIYGRLKLCELIPENRKLFYEGRLTPSVALLVARVPASLQHEAGQNVCFDRYTMGSRECMSYKDASYFIQSNYMLNLKDTQFDKKEDDLAGQPSCVSCTRRTGNQNELFPDVTGKDLCTDPQCFNKKKTAFVHRTIDTLKKEGKTVLSPEESNKLFPYSSSINPERSYHSTAASYYTDMVKEIKYKTLLRKCKDVKLTYAVHPKGILVEMFKREELPRMLKAAGIKDRSASQSAGSGDIQKTKKENRVKDTQRVFWMDKVLIHMDEHCLKVLTLNFLLDSLPYGYSEDILKGRTIKKMYDLNDETLAAHSKKVIEELSDYLENHELKHISEKLGFTMEKDYVITREYLQALTKAQLVALAKELIIEVEGMDTDKKEELVKFIFEHAPKGRVPKELLDK